MSVPLRPLRWLYRIPLLLLALVALALAAVLLAAWLAGARVQGVSWQQGGLFIERWQLLRRDCEPWRGERLLLAASWPLDVRLARAELPACPAPDDEPPFDPLDFSLPSLPPFRLTVDRLELPVMPVVRVLAAQQDGRWLLDAEAPAAPTGNHLVLRHDRASGQWQLAGRLQPGLLVEGLRGDLALDGGGTWRPGLLTGQVTLDGQQLGHASQPQRADARATLTLDNRDWQLEAGLDAPLGLGAGWQLSAHEVLRAAGSFDVLRTLTLDLLASGPQGDARLQLDGRGLAQGSGRLTLSGKAMSGSLPLTWEGNLVRLAPAELRFDALTLALPETLVLPLDRQGSVPLTLALRYRQPGTADVTVSTRGSTLVWRDADWQWAGRADIAGRVSDYRIDGYWQGQAAPAGLSGDPLRIGLIGQGLQLVARVPVADLAPPSWPVQADIQGHYGAYALKGSVTAASGSDGWSGVLDLNTRLPQYTQGGGVLVRLPWRGEGGDWQLEAGGQASVTEGVLSGVLVKPLRLNLESPLRLVTGGVAGRLSLTSGGVVAAAATLPPLSGQVTLAGRSADAELQVSDWGSRLRLSARLPASRSGRDPLATGTLTLASPLVESMSRGLGVTLKGGTLDGEGSWSWQDGPVLAADLRLRDLALDWGGILASGGSGDVRVDWRDGALRASSTAPFRLAELDVGTRIDTIRFDLDTDLQTWHLRGARAGVLGGQVTADALTWPSPDWQTVTVGGIDLAQVAALQSGQDRAVSLAGRVSGSLPLQLGRSTLAVRDGRLANDGPLLLQVHSTPGVAAMAKSNLAVQLALDSLGNLRVDDFRAGLGMSADGWLDAAITIRGDNLQPKRQPVVLNYTHRENVLELLRSLRIGDEISQRVMDRYQNQQRER